MAINKRIELTWNGESCSVLMTMENIERIESKFYKYSLLQMADDLNSGVYKTSLMARMFHSILEIGRVECDHEELHNQLFKSGSDMDFQKALALAWDVLGLVFPPDNKKNSGQPSKKLKSEA